MNLLSCDNRLDLKRAKWGFKTFDNKLVINARSETLLEKVMFKNEVLNHRCIIPVSATHKYSPFF